MTNDLHGLALMTRVRAKRAAYDLGELDALAGQPSTPESVAPHLRVDYRIGYTAGRVRWQLWSFRKPVINPARDNG